MARTRAPGRLEDIAESALQVFLVRGYARTRMADVAKQAGVSSGLLYSYAAGKDALFHLAVLHELDVDLDTLDLPLPAPEPDETASVLRRALRELGAPPALDAALETDDPADPAQELGEIVGSFYDKVNRYRRLVRLVERCALDWPALAERFYVRGRRPFVRRLGGYIERRVRSGHFRPVPDPDVAARFVIETVSWFANHRYGDYDGAQIPHEVARATVVHLVTAALVRP